MTVTAADKPPLLGELGWPQQWTVFAPLNEGDELSDPAQLKSIPTELRVVNRVGNSATVTSIPAVRIAVKPGTVVDLVECLGRQRPKNVAYVFLQLESLREQVVTIGFGADWWLEAWVNGDPVFNTLDSGNGAWPISMTNHTADVALRQGTNVLAVRFISGNATSTLALGGPQEYMAAQRREKRQLAQNLNEFSFNFEDRLIFPVDVQATIMAERDIVFPETDADLTAGELAGLQPMPERQMQGRGDAINPRFDQPVRIRLVKDRYPWEDRHLDAIVWLTTEDEDAELTGELEVLLKTGEGAVLARNTIDTLSPSGLFFSVGFPPQLEGAKGVLEVVWTVDGAEVGRSEAGFSVAAASAVATSGRVPLAILNGPGAVVQAAPMTVGVPFPHGALWDPSHVRLVDEDGREQPLQVVETGRWSRFGPVKWLLCDFTVDLDGHPRQWFLEYGPDVKRAARPPIEVGEAEGGFPLLDTGRLRVADGVVAYDFSSDGTYTPLLTTAALTGAFVQHEQHGLFETPEGVAHSVEQIGSGKVLIRRTGWYVNPDNGERFCQFVTRLAFHRDSPVVRIFHTWIYTGDSNKDRIADMGWLFETAGQYGSGEILSAFDGGSWLSTPSLVQFDFKQYLLPADGAEYDGRAPGVATLCVGDGRVTFGVKDFWQNFPSELAFEEDGLAFYNWPRRNPPARFERPVPVETAYLLRFAHEGEVLDLRMPDEYAERAIWASATRGVGLGPEAQGTHYLEGRPDSINVQGIARTEEMFLYLTPAATSPDAVARVMRGLNDETIRAVVAPQWMTSSGVFGPLHPLDIERFAEEERLYDLVVSAPPTWTERLGSYGKWIYGDYPTWNINLNRASVDNYRAYHKTAHSFPMRLIPFIRTGDPKFLKMADSTTRQLTDVVFRHYASEDVDASLVRPWYLHQGWLTGMSIFPWGGRKGPLNRGISVDSDFLWDSYYLTGYGRARDVALLFGELTKHDSMVIPTTRHSQSSLKSYVDMYQATFDPWFINSAHELAERHIRAFGGEHEINPLTSTPARDATGYDHWREADQAFYRYTGREDFRLIAVNSAVSQTNPRQAVVGAGASPASSMGSAHTTYAWQYTGDPFYLRRAAAALDYLRYSTWEGDIEYFQGVNPRSHGNEPLRVAYRVPRAMAMLADLEEEPEPLHDVVWIVPVWPTKDFAPIYIYHDGNGPLELSIDARGGGVARKEVSLRIEGPQGVVMDGAFETSDENLVFDVPAGVYTIRLTGSSQLFIPMTLPDVPEVLQMPVTERGVETRSAAIGYWFMVPEGVTEFRVRYEDPTGGRWPVIRGSVWNPDGERVWDLNFHNNDLPVEAVITVPPQQAGKLWRVTGDNAILDPQIPPYVSTARSKWFDPEDSFNTTNSH